ncbi:AtpZ/AtpI family protein [Microlunatus speluncae]|uniref:AtpZ/AtpI family protein n=1 Tax=Microlunatus speluncae TaxID=2594267 RepID=UPI001FE9E67B|nr:hypothetical protein [Microlunatus speluncae]
MPAQNPPESGSDRARDAVSRRREALRPTPADMRGMDQAMRVLSYLISGVVVWGGLGWLGDYLLKTNFLLPIGIILGAALGVYVIIRKYGRIDPPASEDSRDPGPDRPDAAETSRDPN